MLRSITSVTCSHFRKAFENASPSSRWWPSVRRSLERTTSSRRVSVLVNSTDCFIKKIYVKLAKLFKSVPHEKSLPKESIGAQRVKGRGHIQGIRELTNMMDPWNSRDVWCLTLELFLQKVFLQILFWPSDLNRKLLQDLFVLQAVQCTSGHPFIAFDRTHDGIRHAQRFWLAAATVDLSIISVALHKFLDLINKCHQVKC